MVLEPGNICRTWTIGHGWSGCMHWTRTDRCAWLNNLLHVYILLLLLLLLHLHPIRYDSGRNAMQGNGRWGPYTAGCHVPGEL